MWPDLSVSAFTLVGSATREIADDYSECSAMKNRGVNEAFTEAARVALSVKNAKDNDAKCVVM